MHHTAAIAIALLCIGCISAATDAARSLDVQFPVFGSPMMIEVESTLKTENYNETVGVTEYFLADGDITRVQVKMADGTTEIHHLDGNADTLFVWTPKVEESLRDPLGNIWESATDCYIKNVTSEIRELQRIFFLNKLLTLDDDTRNKFVYQNETQVRGGDSARWLLSDHLYTTPRFQAKMDVEFFFSKDPWTMPVSRTPMLRKVRVVGATQKIGDRLVNFPFEIVMSVLFMGDSITGLDVFEIPYKCALLLDSGLTTDAPQNGTDANATAASPQTALNPFPIPEIPEAFSAIVETNMIEAQKSFTMIQNTDSVRRLSSTRMVDRLPDLIGRRTERGIVVVGDFQLAYDSEVKYVPLGHELLVEKDLKDLLWPNDHSCNKNVFDFDLVKSVKDMFLIDQSPRYMGSTIVRTIPAKIWQTTGNGYTVQWFFGGDHWNFFNNHDKPLLRMVIRGNGKSPLFVHHPFLVDGKAVPEQAEKACKKFFGEWDQQCSSGEQFYTHVHDFISFLPTVEPNAFKITGACFNSTESAINAFPVAANCDTGLTTGNAVILVLMVAFIAAFISGTFVYLRTNPVKE